MWGLFYLVCVTLTAIFGIIVCVEEGDWVSLSQIILIYFGILFLEDAINHKK